VATALAGTGLSVLLLLVGLPRLHGRAAWVWLQRGLGPLLAVPHAAFAIGVALWLMPSGLPARLLAQPLGWTAPPDVATLQDPWGLGLVLALVAKEWPFLLWCTAAQLARPDLGQLVRHQLRAGRSLGYAAPTLWWRVLWPQLLPRLGWPLAAVWAYALTNVDMALVLGPARPPTLAMLAWGWLQDPDPARQRLGAAAALLLTAVLLLGLLLAWLAQRAWAAAVARRAARGDRVAGRSGGRLALAAVSTVVAGQVAVLALLALSSAVPFWPFPALWPPAFGDAAWRLALGSGGLLANTVGLGLASAGLGLLLALLWLETSPPRRDGWVLGLLMLPLCWPGMLLATGLYAALLPWSLDGTWVGVCLAHGLSTVPYAWLALAPAHRSVDPRFLQVARALGHGRLRFLWTIKGPMLLAPLASAFAVAFAVSVAQYPSTQMVGAGRWPTLTTEALALASGGQRDRVAAFALLQALLPMLVFASAAGVALRQARWSAQAGGGRAP
jgi:putative thiamine transport system permease protein